MKKRSELKSWNNRQALGILSVDNIKVTDFLL